MLQRALVAMAFSSDNLEAVLCRFGDWATPSWQTRPLFLHIDK